MKTQVFICFIALCLAFTLRSNAQNAIFEKLPQDNHLFQRDLSTNRAKVEIKGHVWDWSGFEKLRFEFSNEQGTIRESVIDLDYNNADKKAGFSFEIEIPAERNSHQIALFGLKNGSWEVERIVPGLLAGDVFIINGQSNAQALAAPHPSDIDDYTRSWQDPFGWGTLNLSFPGLWGARLAKQISIEKNLPIAIFNQAVGAEPIDTYLKNASDPLVGNYGDLLKRFDDAGIPRKARAAFWFHGEANAWFTPTEEYFDFFKQLKTSWEMDFAIERTFVFQMRYQSCDSPMPMILEAHRRMNSELTNTDVLSTINSRHDSCHFYYEDGYQLLGDRMSNLVMHRFYDAPNLGAFSPDILRAYPSPSNNRILEIDFKNNPNLKIVGSFPFEDFKLEKDDAKIIGGKIEQTKIKLFLSKTIGDSAVLSYLGHPGPSPDWITNDDGVGIFTFHNFPISADASSVFDEKLENEISVFPNPISGAEFTFSVPESLVAKSAIIEIFNSIGQSVFYEKEKLKTNNSLIINELSKGIHFLKIGLEDGRWFTKQLIFSN